MKLAIMQPYFLPYIGYFQRMNVVEKFVLYDDIQFTKKGWIHRNRFLQNGQDAMFTLPLKRDSDYLYVSQRYLSDNFEIESQKIIRRLSNAYKNAPYYKVVMPILENIFSFNERNLFRFVFNSIMTIKAYLGIDVEIIVSSSLEFNNKLRSQEKVLDICRVCEADLYLDSTGAVELYDKVDFENQNITLCFLKTKLLNYEQLNNEFIPALSIIDVMMFNSPKIITNMLDCYELE